MEIVFLILLGVLMLAPLEIGEAAMPAVQIVDQERQADYRLKQGGQKFHATDVLTVKCLPVLPAACGVLRTVAVQNGL